MKIKSFLIATMFAITLFSCSKDNDNNIENNSATQKQILNFASEKEMQEKIAEIEAFRNAQEQEILQKILRRNNLSAPTSADLKNTSNKQLTEVDKAKVMEDVKFYHQEKLKAIYAERAHFGFTSIQSIADEINFNKLIDQKKADKLLDINSDLIVSNGYFAKVKNQSKESIISNVTGEYILKSKTINSNIIETVNTNRLVGLKGIKEGILASNGFYAVTYHVGYSTHKDDINVTFYGNFTQYGSFVNGALYPSWFYTNSNSNCTFSPYGNPLDHQTVPFISSAGDIVRNDVTLLNGLVGNRAYDWINTNHTNQVSGTYVTPIGGQFVTLKGYKNLN